MDLGNNSSVCQDSILDPSLFIIFLNDLFLGFTHDQLSNYADDNTLHCIGNKTDDVNNELRIDLA